MINSLEGFNDCYGSVTSTLCILLLQCHHSVLFTSVYLILCLASSGNKLGVEDLQLASQNLTLMLQNIYFLGIGDNRNCCDLTKK